MRIGNRTSMRITNARLTREAKTRAWSGGAKKSLSVRGTGTGSNPSILEVLRGMNKNSEVSTGQSLLINQQKSISYDTMKVAADRVSGHMDRFLATGEDSLFGKADSEEAKDAAVKEINAFVANYNMMVGKLTKSGNSVEKAYANKLRSCFGGKTAALKAAGITVGIDGTLSVDQKKLEQAEFSDLKAIFGSEGGVADKLREQAKVVHGYAGKQLEALKKESSLISSNYSRYGTTSDIFSDYLNRYNAKG